MAQNSFRARNGLDVGISTVASVDGTTGNITTTGDIAVNGGDITTTSTTANVVNTNATTVNIAGAGTAVNIGASTGTTTINNTNTVVTGDLRVNGNDIKSSTGNTAITLNDTGATIGFVGLGIDQTGAVYNGVISNLSPSDLIIQAGSTLRLQNDFIQLEKDNGTANSYFNVRDARYSFNSADNGVYNLYVNGTFNATTSARTPSLIINGATSGSSTFTAPATGSTLSYVLPGTAGAASTVLTNDGSGNLSWALPGGGGSTFGNVTVGVVTDNTISTTTGDLDITSATSQVNISTNLTVSGDVAVNGGDITTTQTTASVFNTNATTLNIGGGATTAVNIGNSSGEIDTPSDIQILGNKSIRQGSGIYAGSTDIYRNVVGTPLEGILISNNNMTSVESGLVIRNYGETATGINTITTPGQIYLQGTRGTLASPLANNTGATLGQIIYGSNLGDTTGAGTGNGWTNDLYTVAAQPASLLVNATQNHRQTPQATFTASLAGTTLTVTAVASGTITPGQELRRADITTFSTIIARQITSTAAGNALGSTGTYQITSGGSFTSRTCNTYSVSAGTQASLNLLPTTANGTTASAVPAAVNLQTLTFAPDSSGGLITANYKQINLLPAWNSFPVASRIITEITGGNTLNIGTHNYTTPGATFIVGTAGNPNGLITGATYYIDTIPSTTTITLRTNSVSGGAVTGLTNGSNLFIAAQNMAQSFTGDRTGSVVQLYGRRSGNNYNGGIGGNNTTDVNRTNDNIGSVFFAGFRNTGATVAQTSIQGRCTEDWVSSTNIGSEILINTVKTGTGTIYTTQLGAGSTVIRTDNFDVFNTAGTNTLDLDVNGNLIVTGDLRINGNDIQASDGLTNISMTSNTLTTFAGDIRINGNDLQASDGNTNITLNSNTLTTFAGDIRINGNDILNSTNNTAITMATGANPLVTIAGDIRLNGNDIQNSAGNNNINLSSTATNINADRVNFFTSNTDGLSNIQFSPGNAQSGTVGGRGTQYGLFHRRNPAQTGEKPFASFNNWVQDPTTLVYSPNLSGEFLGALEYSGQYSTTTTPTSAGVAVRFSGLAAENFTSTANGGRATIDVVKIGTTTSYSALSLDSNDAYIRSNSIYLQDNNSTTLQLTNATESRYRSARHVFGQVVGGATIFDITDTGSGTTGVSSVYSNPYQTSTSGINQTSVFSSDTTSTLQISGVSSTGSTVSTVNLQSYRRSAGNNAATQTNDRLGQLTFNGNTNTGTGGPTTPVVGGEIRFYATENWTGSATGSGVALEVVKQGTTTNTNVFLNDGLNTEIRGDQISFDDMSGTALTSANINYTRTFGEFAYTNAAGFAIAAQNTIYTMPLDTTLSNSGVTISGTGNININVSGWYKIIISLQATLTVSNQPGQFDFWLRKNGADVANSKTQVDLLKDQKSVISMDWLVNSDGNDYWEIVYVGTTTNYADIDFPTIAATTTPYVSPVAPALLVNVIPAGM
jgi:hypothetical protein